MNLTNHTILITGGATGIGLALAEEFLKHGNTVLVCGRREDKLKEAKEKFPQLHTKVCDVTDQKGREELLRWVTGSFPELNVLVNNAGIQREVSFTDGSYNTAEVTKEVETNLLSPLHLSALFIPHLAKKPEAYIINITSGLGFAPIARMPVYCSAKAAMHSISLSMRHQLRNTSVKVFEIAPPIVDTELDQGARKKRGMTHFGITAAECAAMAIDALQNDVYEAALGQANGLRLKREELFATMNQ